jgi:methylthioribose-1-phosphate isomerase
MSKDYQPIEWLGDKLRILDQTRLPFEEAYLDLTDYREVAEAIKELRVRGAPAIGVAGAYAIVLGALKIKAKGKEEFLKEFKQVCRDIAATRPTAKNLFRAVERMEKGANSAGNIEDIRSALVNEAVQIHKEEAEATYKLSRLGAELIKDGFTVLTHCNTGALATTGYGTALGVIRAAFEQGKKIRVYASETRPLLQGARLTVWECKKAGIPVTLITDSMSGYFMNRKEIDSVIVGADRIAVNGDTANKIGTYTHAVLAKENGVPFYVAAPTSTIDPAISSGEQIPIEQRSSHEVTHIQGMCTAPDCAVANPAFDVTPARYITAIITERAIIRPPFEDGIRKIV